MNNPKLKKGVDVLRYGLTVILLILTMSYGFQELRAIPTAGEEALFEGAGTREDPYQISSEADLALLAETVNGGEVFSGCYFRQTRDLDLIEYENWTPIGIFGGGYAFSGAYDGEGHVIRNLQFHGEGQASANGGLFGVLAGTVCNLGIESGEITGACCGAITSHSSGDKAMIINCYNKASITGGRCGGIADNFGGGKIICCWNEGELNGDKTGAITSYTARTVYGCAGLQQLTNDNFQGDVLCSEVCDKIDVDAMQANLKQARYEFDLQYIYG